jgi:hypothetical protein
MINKKNIIVIVVVLIIISLVMAFSPKANLAYDTTVARWIKITKSYSDFATAGATNNIEIYSLPSKGVVHMVQINPSVPFSGGTIATYTISVGTSGVLAKYATATNVFTGSTLPAISVLPAIESVSGATSIRAAAISSVGLLNAATQGNVEIWLFVSILP